MSYTVVDICTRHVLRRFNSSSENLSIIFFLSILNCYFVVTCPDPTETMCRNEYVPPCFSCPGLTEKSST